MKRLWLTSVLLFVSMAPASWAQDVAPIIAGYQSHGSLTAGYRFTGVSGRSEKFDELFGLRDGFRVHQIDWFGRAVGGTSFADTISLTSTGLGGDPDSATTLRLRRNGVWEAGVSLRRSYYYWDRNDDAVQPSGLNGLTSNHDYATVRRLGSFDFSQYVSSDLRISFEYNRTRREGDRFSTRSLEYFDPTSEWGSFARANAYRVRGPADEASNRFTGGVTWSPESWTFFVRGGYQRYNEALEVNNLVSPQPSINVDDPATATELLTSAEWTETRRVSAPFTEFSYNGTLRSGLRIRGGYIYYRYGGPSRTSAAFSGIARADRTGTAFAPFDVTQTVDGEMREPLHVIDQGMTLDLTDWIAFHADYRYSRSTVRNEIQSASTDADGLAMSSEELVWERGTHTLDTALEILPADNLLLRPGIRLVKRDVTFLEDGIAEPEASRRSKIASPILSVYYTPVSGLTFRGDIRNTTNDGPYTRVTPRTDFGGRWVIRYAPGGGRLSLENAFRFRNSDYTATDFENNVRLNSTSLYFVISDALTLTGGFTYDSYVATAGVEFLRGTPPSDVTWRDQTVSRIWQAGFEIVPDAWMRLQLMGNYVRTTGVGEISGEAPTFGPLTWPMMTGTAEFDIPSAGTLAIDLQRTYYIEEIVEGNNFRANVLGIRWIVDF